jgi:hypothetical protein
MKLPGYRYTCEMMKKLRFLVSLHTRENDFQVAQAKPRKIPRTNWGAMR